MRQPFAYRLLALASLGAAVAAAPSISSAQTPAPQPMIQGTAPAPRPEPAPAAPSGSELSAAPAGAEKLELGIASQLLRPGKGGPKPTPDDIVAFFSIGRTVSGTVLQDTFAKGKPQRLLLKTTFEGWRVALASMTAGEIRRFWIPAAALPPNPETGTAEPAVFDVELVQVASLPKTPKYLAKPDPAAKRSAYGAYVMTLAKGSGQKPLKRTDGALVDFTLWNDQGQPVLSSIAEGRPTLFPVERVMPAFGDCLEGMSIGERRMCWIPADKNSGFPGVKSGALVFQLDLVNNMDYNRILSKPKPGNPAALPPPPGGTTGHP